MEYGCIGERLTHSFSAEIHPKLFDYKYELKELKKEDLPEFLNNREFKAINVTIPYKQEVIPYLDFIDDTAKAIGAVNTVVNKNGSLYGFNTDFSGMRALLAKNNIKLSGKKVIVLGSGGTSKTATAVAEAEGAASIFRVSRSGKDGCITYEQLYEGHTDADIIINTTPSGMFPNIGESCVDIKRFGRLSGVADAVYNPLRSRLVCEALSCGIPVAGGLYMLIAQAAFAAELFIGEKVPKEKIDRIFCDMQRDKSNIVLIGMPACGKSTVGGILSDKLKRELIDTDSEIIKKAGKSISEIFAEVGENGFRDIESEVIKEVSKNQGVVIATGGGAVLRRENIALLKENGIVFFLDRPLQLLITTPDRPLSSNKADLERRYNERYEIYKSSADVIIDAAPSAEECADIIKEKFHENTYY